jgi:hypothetical protein
VLAAVGAHGFALIEARSIEGWTTLVLERR